VLFLILPNYRIFFHYKKRSCRDSPAREKKVNLYFYGMLLPLHMTSICHSLLCLSPFF